MTPKLDIIFQKKMNAASSSKKDEVPGPSRVDSAFDEIQEVLEKHKVGKWSMDEMSQLGHLVTEFARSTRKRARDDDGETNDADEAQCKDSTCTEHHHHHHHQRHATDEQDDDEEDERYLKSLNLFKYLGKIRQHLRKAVPFGRPEETVVVPQHSATFTATTPTFEIDAFLYDEDDVDELAKAGKVSREYCEDCRSTKIGLSQFISHSFSREQLVFIFSYAIPSLLKRWEGTSVVKDSKAPPQVNQLVDVGSRYGIVLAAAFSAAIAKSIVGLELNAYFVAQQQAMIQKFSMGPTVSASQLDVTSEEGLAVLAASDVVVLHNVFEWFSNEKDQLSIWKKIRQALSRPGQLLIVCPQLDESLLPLAATFEAKFDVAAFVESWVTEMNVAEVVEAFKAERLANLQQAGDDELDEDDEVVELVRSIHFYRVN